MRKLGLSQYINKLAPVAGAKLDDPIRGSEERVVATAANIAAWVELGATLANQNGPGGYFSAVVYLDAEALCV